MCSVEMQKYNICIYVMENNEKHVSRRSYDTCWFLCAKCESIHKICTIQMLTYSYIV